MRGLYKNSFKRGTVASPKAQQEPRLPHVCVCGGHSGFTNLKLRGREYTEGMGRSNQHRSSIEGSSEWRIRDESLVQERQALVYKRGAKCLRFAAVSQILLQTGEPNPYLQDYKLSRLARPGSGISCCVHFLRGKREKC